MGSTLEDITVLQRSVSELWVPTDIIMGKDVYNNLSREAESCSMVQISGSGGYVPNLREVNGLEIKISDAIGKNQVMFCSKDGNFSNFFLVNIENKKPKRKGRYLRIEVKK